MKNYQQRLTDYHDAVRLYTDRSQGRINRDFEAEGYREPSMLSVFSTGLEYVLPDKVVIKRDGGAEAVKDASTDNPYSFMFGKIDLVFNVGFVLSLLAIIFTFSSIQEHL